MGQGPRPRGRRDRSQHPARGAPDLRRPGTRRRPEGDRPAARALLRSLNDRREQTFGAARFAARVVIERRLEPWEAHRIFALAQAMPESPEALGLYLRR